MKRIALLGVALALSGTLCSPLYADKPSWAGGGDRLEKGKGKGQARNGPGAEKRGAYARGSGPVFSAQHRDVIRDYYATQFRGGRCPPGLAKKNNGCMPPGLAKKWHVGQPLPREVIYHDLPATLVVEIGMPPAGYKYVRVAADILLIAVGTGMVVSAIEDLGRL